MSLVLDSWARRWQSVAFEPVKGLGKVRWFSRKPAHCSGWALKEGATWYALWSQGESLVFQAGGKQWPMTESYSCRNVRRGEDRIFTILANGKQEFELRYKAKDNDADPPFDLHELEMTDFFFWVSKIWADPTYRRELAANWARGGVVI